MREPKSPEEWARYVREYRAAHRDRINAQKRARYRANRDRILEQQRQRYRQSKQQNNG